MRITTQMMHASAKKAGISLGGASLLNYIDSGNNQNAQGTLLNALNAKQNVAVNKTQAANHKKLEETADSLLETLETVMEEGEEGIFHSSNTEKSAITDTVKKLVKEYNDTVKVLKNTSNPLNDFYGEMLKEAVEESEEGLSNVGITQNERGMLVLDEERLKGADIETIKKALDGNGLFSSKTAYIVSRISDNAKTNIESYSCQYGADGYSYVANRNKYNFWG